MAAIDRSSVDSRSSASKLSDLCSPDSVNKSGITAPGQFPLVSIIIVNFNGKEYLANCLDSIFDDNLSPSFEIIVVDNASPDRSWEIAKQYEGCDRPFMLLKSDKNLGYSGGINYALPHVSGKYIAILNMDTIVSSGWLSNIVDFFESHQEVGAVSPILLLEKDRDRVNASGLSIHVTALGCNCGLGQLGSEFNQEPVRVSGIHGGAFVIRGSIVEKIRGFNDKGFLYNEDVEISWLLLLMGYDLYCLPSSLVYHDYFLSIDPIKLYLLERNRILLLLTYLQWKSVLAMLPLLLFTELMIWCFCIWRGIKFLFAKSASYRWVIAQHQHIFTRKKFIHSLRKRTDWQVLKCLSWNFEWKQFFLLGRERGTSIRRSLHGDEIFREKILTD